MASSPSPSVFGYANYRTYLRDVYEHRKGTQRGFSFRWFAQKAGLASPNFLKLVIDGQRNLSTKGVEAFARALGLTARERDCFADLVQFEQAATAAEKTRAWERLSSYQARRKVRAVTHQEFEYLSRWYYPVVRELISLPGFREDPRWIARQVRPAITAAQAKAALEVLLALGLVERDDAQRLRPRDKLLSTGAEVRSLAVGNFHRQMMERGAESIERFDREEREISGLTVSISAEGVRTFKERIHALRAELLELAGRDEHADRVMQLNFQLFPVAILDGEGESEHAP
jgi:uncharacterized protein (TIGR02147 family)